MKEVTKTEEVDSFFNFFKSRKVPKEDEEDEKLIEAIQMDIGIAEEIRDSLIPQALFHYMSLEFFGDDGCEGEEDSDGSEKETGGKKDKSAKRKAIKEAPKKECKQQ